jgi:tetratricopeptide (TPR) repeat protein
VRSLQIREEQLGATHPDTATSLNNLALLYYSMGRYDQAEPLYVRALVILLNTLGENHPNTQTGWKNYIVMLAQAVEAGHGETLWQSGSEITRNILSSLFGIRNSEG